MEHETKQVILRAALTTARRHGLYNMTRSQIAATAGVSPALVSHYFADMMGLRTAVVKAAIERVNFLDVLAEALARRDYHAMRAPAEVKRAALNTLA